MLLKVAAVPLALRMKQSCSLVMFWFLPLSRNIWHVGRCFRDVFRTFFVLFDSDFQSRFSPPPKVGNSWNCTLWWLSEFSAGLWSVWGRNSSHNSKLYNCLHPTLWFMESTDPSGIQFEAQNKTLCYWSQVLQRKDRGFQKSKLEARRAKSTRSAAKFLLRNQDVSPSASPSSFHSPSGGCEWLDVLCFWVLLSYFGSRKKLRIVSFCLNINWCCLN